MASISKLFFDRFSSNQDDWKFDHEFIFRYTEDLMKEYEECNAVDLAKSMRIVEETKPHKQ